MARCGLCIWFSRLIGNRVGFGGMTALQLRALDEVCWPRHRRAGLLEL